MGKNFVCNSEENNFFAFQLANHNYNKHKIDLKFDFIFYIATLYFYDVLRLLRFFFVL